MLDSSRKHAMKPFDQSERFTRAVNKPQSRWTIGAKAAGERKCVERRIRDARFRNNFEAAVYAAISLASPALLSPAVGTLKHTLSPSAVNNRGLESKDGGASTIASVAFLYAGRSCQSRSRYSEKMTAN